MAADEGQLPTLLEHQLATHHFTQGLLDDDVETLLECASLVDFKSRDTIFLAGEPAEQFYLVRTGVVALQVSQEVGTPRPIQSIAEGSVLGWSWLFEPPVWQFDAVAETAVRTIAIETDPIRQVCAKNGPFGYRLLSRISEIMAARLHATRRQFLSQRG